MAQSSDTMHTLVHLQSAAHSLARTSPALAAHIYQRFVETAAEEGVVLPVQLARMACAGCHAVWVPGYNLKVVRSSESSSNNNSNNNNNDSTKPLSQGKILCYICLSCERVTRFTSTDPPKTQPSTPLPSLIPPASSTPSRPHPLSSSSSSSSQVSTASSPRTPLQTAPSAADKVATGSSGKKRQKMRKQNSLHMMLAKAKAEREGKQGGLGLLDMMKSAGK
ncbi:hypothetical protein BZA70DRAFT_296757 [Myxozyma melibiosi]|uniref:Uncharacterized protein n=1 Tax=Myxozyma melibiosi TaxID=54550 RepID=A0ABR1F292_9ASCO